MHNDKMAAALALAARGLRVFPLPPNGTVPSADWAGWPEHATTDPEKIRAWWDGTDQNIAVCSSGWLIIDLDQKRGRNGIGAWLALHGGFDTFTVRTKSGGLHLYYSGADVAGSASELGDGIDVRSHHNYVVGPGSVVDGAAYEVLFDEPFAPAPQEIVGRCKPPGVRTENHLVPLVDLDTPAAVQAALERVARAPAAMQGEQSEAAYKLACAVRDHGISEALCSTIMAPWGARCAPPVIGDDLRGRIANAYAYAQNAAGAKHPEMMFGKLNIEPQPTPQEVQTSQAVRSGLRRLAVGECAAPRGYVLKNMIVPGQFGCIFGQPGAGKSVVAPHLAYAVAQGRRAFGQRTKQGTVFYVAAEDEKGMQERFEALRLRHGDAPSLHLYGRVSALVTGNDAVAPDMARLLQLVEEHRPSLIVVDTMAMAVSGLDENSSDDMGKIVKAMQSLAELGPAVVLIHHSPKSGDTPRGHSVLNGALDMSMIVGPDPDAEDLIRGELKKNRNGTLNLDIAFRIESAAMGQDEDGDPITAPVCLERTEDEARADRKMKLKAGEGKALAVLHQMTQDQLPANASGDRRLNGKLPSIALLDWQERCTSKGVMSNAAKPGARNREFNTARNGLVGKNCIYIADGRVTYLGYGNEDLGKRPKTPPSQFGHVVLPQPGQHVAVSGQDARALPPPGFALTVAAGELATA